MTRCLSRQVHRQRHSLVPRMMGIVLHELLDMRSSPQYPSLVQLHLNSKIHHKMAGVKTFAEVTLTIDNKPITKVTRGYSLCQLRYLRIGDFGYQSESFACPYETSSVWAYCINLLPRFDEQTLRHTLEQLFISVPNHPIETVLSTLLPAKTIPYLCEEAVINPAKSVSKLSEKELQKLISSHSTLEI